MAKDDGSEAQPWHIDKTVNISHMLATLTVVTGLFWWGSDIEKQVALNAASISHGSTERHRIESQTRESLGRIENYLIRIEDKLDNKADR